MKTCIGGLCVQIPRYDIHCPYKMGEEEVEGELGK